MEGQVTVTLADCHGLSFVPWWPLGILRQAEVIQRSIFTSVNTNGVSPRDNFLWMNKTMSTVEH